LVLSRFRNFNHGITFLPKKLFGLLIGGPALVAEDCSRLQRGKIVMTWLALLSMGQSSTELL
jgi:hypothetical protein